MSSAAASPGVVGDEAALRRALAAKPRHRAYAYITESLHRSLARRGEGFLPDLRGDRVELRLGRGRGCCWVHYVLYDDAYETPDEFYDSDDIHEVCEFPECGRPAPA